MKLQQTKASLIGRWRSSVPRGQRADHRSMVPARAAPDRWYHPGRLWLRLRS